LGLLNYLHPFDGCKFRHVYESIKNLPDIAIKAPEAPVSQELINPTMNELLVRLVKNKRYILRALEVPYIPLLPYSVIDSRVLLPMRWAVAGTLAAAKQALAGTNCWNMAGGYHHASPHNAEGFCVYNDIAITHHELASSGLLPASDKILIVDVDAHHGNGNAYYFMENRNVTILDIYNDDIYPRMPAPKARVDIGVPLHTGTTGAHYLNALHNALNQIQGTYKLAFVVAGTDVLAVDPLGGFGLTIDDCVARDKMVLEKLRSLSIPFVVLGGGGYSKDSAKVISKSIAELYMIN
ncbi:MAG: histone deacetylase, partial [Gammaproteobacteria bacterium]|nr:histone deacetylase [Gammaproteobacteria bacterium]